MQPIGCVMIYGMVDRFAQLGLGSTMLASKAGT